MDSLNMYFLLNMVMFHYEPSILGYPYLWGTTIGFPTKNDHFGVGNGGTTI